MILRLGGVVARVAVLALSIVATISAKPNLIVIMADDIGASELSSYGHPKHRTPNIDALGRTGVQFETCYTSPVCHPTRFTLMTGQYGHRTGVFNFAGKRGGPAVRHEGPDNIANHLTFAQPLKAAGYATAIAGKWQLSGHPPTLVRETGFDEYCIWGYGEHYTAEDRAKAQAAGIDFRSRYWHPSICRNGQWMPTSTDDYGPDIFTDFLIQFLKRHREQPFFIYFPMPLTHGPWLPTPESFKPGDDRVRTNRANFQANVEYMDKLVGRLIRALDESGVRENTIVFFTGDNGTGGDGKSTATEKGARVPLIVNGPGLVKTRGVTAALADTSDVFPTLMELAGASIPAKHVVDGRSMAAFLSGQRDTTRDWIFAYQADRRILRTERWLLEDNSPRHWGQMFDCGERRDGTGYQDVTNSTAAEALEARRYFERLLQDLPAPRIDHDGAPNENNDSSRKEGKREQRKKRKSRTDPE
jgi:arylsulfatase A